MMSTEEANATYSEGMDGSIKRVVRSRTEVKSSAARAIQTCAPADAGAEQQCRSGGDGERCHLQNGGGGGERQIAQSHDDEERGERGGEDTYHDRRLEEHADGPHGAAPPGDSADQESGHDAAHDDDFAGRQFLGHELDDGVVDDEARGGGEDGRDAAQVVGHVARLLRARRRSRMKDARPAPTTMRMPRMASASGTSPQTTMPMRMAHRITQ
jgi:hypothetical protein